MKDCFGEKKEKKECVKFPWRRRRRPETVHLDTLRSVYVGVGGLGRRIAKFNVVWCVQV